MTSEFLSHWDLSRDSTYKHPSIYFFKEYLPQPLVYKRVLFSCMYFACIWSICIKKACAYKQAFTVTNSIKKLIIKKQFVWYKISRIKLPNFMHVFHLYICTCIKVFIRLALKIEPFLNDLTQERISHACFQLVKNQTSVKGNDSRKPVSIYMPNIVWIFRNLLTWPKHWIDSRIIHRWLNLNEKQNSKLLLIIERNEKRIKN